MKKTLLFLIFFLTTYTISAQNPTEIDQTFGSYPGFNDIVFVTVLQPDGKILVGGRFSAYRGAAENGLIRLNSDGSKDTSFSNGIEGTIYSIALQDDGKIIVGGTFIKFNNTTQNYLIRLNPDGTKDFTFDIGSGFTSKKNDNNFLGVVSSILIQNDGKILVGGNFIEYQGTSQKYLIRLNSDGSKDSSFDIGTGFDNGVYCIARQNDGKIIVGGMFDYFQGRISSNIARLNNDGSEDKTFKKGNGFDYYVKSLIIQPDEKIIASGFFYEYDGNIKRHLVRLNKDGTNDTSFYIKNGFNFRVDAIALRQDGKIMVGGAFTNYSLTDNYHLIRLNTDGSMDTSFKIGNGFSIYNGPTVNSINIQPDGKLILGGDFTSFQDLNENYLIRLNENGSKDPSFDIGSGLNNVVNIVTIQSDNKIVVGGKFNKYQGIHQKNLIRFNDDGSKDESLNIGEGFNGAVNSISQQIDGKIIVGGAFNKFKNEDNFYLIRLNSDGTKDNSFNIGTLGFSRDINTTVIQKDGKILVGGNFGSYQNKQQGRLIRLNTDGSKDTSFDIGSGFNTDVLTIALQVDGKIIVGGKFQKYKGISQNYLIRLNNDGSKDETFDIGVGFGSTYTLGDIHSIIVQPDGKIIVGGKFSFFQGNIADGIIRLNPDGSRDLTFKTNNNFTGYILSMALQKDGKILVAGGISPRIMRINSNGSFDSSFIASQFNIPYFSISENDSSLKTVALQNNGKIIIGGAFTSYKNDNASAFIIRLKGTEVVLSNEDFIKEKKSFSVWPNPVKNTLNINSLNESNYSVKIYDLLGRLIYTKENVNTSIDVSSFTSGLYLIKIKAENGEASQKFIKI
ncbi:T9SS type A sorting domain-containing protein [Flavobacterium sp. UW10123]|uniref:T9SS type A sorting domain-containing protein n=1 Tax=Flavobacterium sp. UW10123 TaxID=3230800 RepID=UPI0033993727